MKPNVVNQVIFRSIITTQERALISQAEKIVSHIPTILSSDTCGDISPFPYTECEMGSMLAPFLTQLPTRSHNTIQKLSDDSFLSLGFIIAAPGFRGNKGTGRRASPAMKICRLLQSYPCVPLVDGGQGKLPIIASKPLPQRRQASGRILFRLRNQGVKLIVRVL